MAVAGEDGGAGGSVGAGLGAGEEHAPSEKTYYDEEAEPDSTFFLGFVKAFFPPKADLRDGLI